MKRDGDKKVVCSIYVFDGHKTLLRPYLLRHPGQLKIITELEFDLFGVSIGNLHARNIFWLPEIH